MNMQELIASVAASVAASGALVVILAWLSREWITARLKTSIQHEYDQKLESLRAQLKAQNDVALVELRAAIERQAGLLAAAHSSFAEGQKAAMERTLQAVDLLWTRVLHIRSSLPPVLSFIDVLTVDEYKGVQDHPQFRSLSQGWSTERITTLVDKDTEIVRPYVGEYAWAVFYSYQAVMLRVVFLLHLGRDDASKLEWHKDTGTRQLILAVLSPKEVDEFDAAHFGKITWLQRRLETKILAASRKLISGESFGADALEQAKLIQQKLANLEPRTV